MAYRNWNQETKNRLTEKVDGCVDDLGSLARQIIRGSRSNELLGQAAKNFAFQENAIQNSLTSLKKMGLLTNHLQFQAEAIERRYVEKLTLNIGVILCGPPFAFIFISTEDYNMDTMDNIQDQLKTIQR